MKKDFTLRPEASELRALGFNEPCMAYYDCDWDFVFSPLKSSFLECEIASPTYAQAFRWFREKHKLHSSVDFDQLKQKDDEDDIELYHFTINEQWTVGKDWYDYKYGFKNHTFCRNLNTYEEAELACLRKLIEIVKQQQNESK